MDGSLTHWYLGDLDVILFSTLLNWLAFSNLLMILSQVNAEDS